MSSEREMLKHVDVALRALASDPDKMQSIKLGQLPEIARKAMPKDVEMNLTKKQLKKRLLQICSELAAESATSSSESESEAASENPAMEDASEDDEAEHSRSSSKRKKRKRGRQIVRRSRAGGATHELARTPLARLAQDIGTRETLALAAASLKLNLSKMSIQSVSDAVLDEALGILARIRVTLSQTAQKDEQLEVNRTGFLDLMRCRFHELIACTNEDLTLHTINAFSQRFEATWRLDNLRDVDAIIARTEDNLEEVEREVLVPLQVEETTLDSNECDLAGHWQGVSDEVELGDAFVVKKPLRAAAHQMWAESGPTHVAFAVRPASAMVSLLRRGAQPPRASAVSCIGLEAGAVSFFDNVLLALEHHKKTSVLTRASGLYLVCFDLALGPRERCVDVKSVPPSLPTGANAARMSVTSALGHEGKRWLIFNSGQARLHSFAKLV